jgi:dethiobiotin synthetase
VPVILVSGIRMGCLNHTLLTAEKIQQAGLTIGGWVANCLDPNMECMQENIDTLKEHLDAPFLGVVPYSSQLDLDKMSKHIDVAAL